MKLYCVSNDANGQPWSALEYPLFLKHLSELSSQLDDTPGVEIWTLIRGHEKGDLHATSSITWAPSAEEWRRIDILPFTTLDSMDGMHSILPFYHAFMLQNTFSMTMCNVDVPLVRQQLFARVIAKHLESHLAVTVQRVSELKKGSFRETERFYYGRDGTGSHSYSERIIHPRDLLHTKDFFDCIPIEWMHDDTESDDKDDNNEEESRAVTTIKRFSSDIAEQREKLLKRPRCADASVVVKAL